MGRIAAFGAVEGDYRKFHLTLRVVSEENTEPPVVFRTQIALHAPSGMIFTQTQATPLAQEARHLVIEPTLITFEPKIPCMTRSMSYEFFVAANPTTLQSSIDRLCELGTAIIHDKSLMAS